MAAKPLPIAHFWFATLIAPTGARTESRISSTSAILVGSVHHFYTIGWSSVNSAFPWKNGNPFLSVLYVEEGDDCSILIWHTSPNSTSTQSSFVFLDIGCAFGSLRHRGDLGHRFICGGWGSRNHRIILHISIRHWKAREAFEVSFYQCFFLFAAPALNLFFPVKGFVNSAVFLIINQFNRKPFPGMVCTFTGLVLLKT